VEIEQDLKVWDQEQEEDWVIAQDTILRDTQKEHREAAADMEEDSALAEDGDVVMEEDSGDAAEGSGAGTTHTMSHITETMPCRTREKKKPTLKIWSKALKTN